ncbi:MAG: hypothetical protein OEY88_11620 [Candidatus Bathyarchaeota archaeon]|nr:hypothetical protein [Candidatus Bathyarchaeota archaeon]
MLDLMIGQVGYVGKFQRRTLLAGLWDACHCWVMLFCLSVDFLDPNWNADNTDIDTYFFTLHASLFTEEES